MKKLLLALTFLCKIASAQDSLVVTELNHTFYLGSRSAFCISIPQATMKAVTSDWKSYLKSSAKRSVNEKDGEIMMAKGPITNVCSDSVTVFSNVTSDGSRTKVYVGFMMNDSSFISSIGNQEKANAASFFVRQFGILAYKNAVNIEIVTELKRQKSIEDKIEDLGKDNEKLKSKISDNERYISRKKDDIRSNESDQEIKNKLITDKKVYLSAFTGTEDQKLAEEKKLKELTKAKENLLDDKESMEKKIADKESDNRSLQKEIDKNNEEIIPAAKADLAAEKNVVAAIQAKLARIK